MPDSHSPDIVGVLGGPQVTIIVGKERKEFVLPKALLCHHSKYFDRCFNGQFLQAYSQKVELIEDDSQAFSLLVKWIYISHTIRGFNLTGSQIVTHAEHGPESIRLSLYIKALVLADMLDIQQPVAMICGHISKCISHDGWILLPYHIRAAYALPKSHPFRGLCAKVVVKPFLRRHLKDNTFPYEKELEEVEGFAKDVLDAVSNALAPGNVFVGQGLGERVKVITVYDIFVKHPLLVDRTFRPWKN